MTDLLGKVTNYNSVTLETYVNNILNKPEKCIIETERHNLKKLQKEINTELFRAFILNTDNLLEILRSYNDSYDLVKDLRNLSADYKKLKIKDTVYRTGFIDKEKHADLERILGKFGTDGQTFLTDERYLVHFEMLYSKDVKVIVILTNDIVIIGDANSTNASYTLLNAFNYSIIDMKLEDSKLFITVDPIHYEFIGDVEKIKKLYKTYKELTYVYTEVSSQPKDEVDDDLVSYLLETEQYDQISAPYEYELPEIDYYDDQDLIKHADLFTTLNRDFTDYLYKFLNRRFSYGLRKINKVQPLDSLIVDVFDYFNLYFKEGKELVLDLVEHSYIRRCGLVLLVESQLLQCFGVLENRIFNRFFEIKCMQSSLELIRSKLKFQNCDFEYLMDYFTDKEGGYKWRCKENAKKEIRLIVNEMLEEFTAGLNGSHQIL